MSTRGIVRFICVPHFFFVDVPRYKIQQNQIKRKKLSIILDNIEFNKF